MTKNARAVLKQFVEAIEQDDISPTMSTGFEKAYQNALAVLREPADTAPAEAKAVRVPDAMKPGNDNPQSWVAGWNACRHEVLRLNPAPAAAEADYRSMFLAAVSALAAIDDALGIEADGCNEPEITLYEIAQLKAAAELVGYEVRANDGSCTWAMTEDDVARYRGDDRYVIRPLTYADTAPAPSSEADKRDAERYRWLRATDPIEWPISLSADSILAPDYFDAAIDAAQKEAGDAK